MAYVYILKSLDNQKYYIGSMIDVEKMSKHHLSGGTPSTKRLGELELVLKQEYSNLSSARKVEFRLKKYKRKDFIDKIVKEGYIKFIPRWLNGRAAPC